MQMPTDMPHIFAISDIGVQVVLTKKAVHEAHVAVDVIPAAKDRPLHATHFPICVQFRRATADTASLTATRVRSRVMAQASRRATYQLGL